MQGGKSGFPTARSGKCSANALNRGKHLAYRSPSGGSARGRWPESPPRPAADAAPLLPQERPRTASVAASQGSRAGVPGNLTLVPLPTTHPIPTPSSVPAIKWRTLPDRPKAVTPTSKLSDTVQKDSFGVTWLRTVWLVGQFCGLRIRCAYMYISSV